MKAGSENPDADLLDGMPSTEEFGSWLAADRANYDHFLHIVERSLDVGRGGSSLESPDRNQMQMEKDRAGRAMQVVTEKSKALMEVMRLPAGAMPADELLSRSNALMNEIADLLLELPERNRTRFLKEMVYIRDRLRAVWNESDQ